MSKLFDQVHKVRSKNAGPFWVTIDVFCGDTETFDSVRTRLKTDQVARLFGQPVEHLKRFEIANIFAIKFSLPRPVVQGARDDRDMHGAQWAVLLAEFELGD